MKDKIKNWIVNLIKDTYPKLPSPSDFKTVFDDYIKQYSPAECCHCHKNILAHYGGFYRNSKGQVFCSHQCIDNYGSGETKHE